MTTTREQITRLEAQRAAAIAAEQERITRENAARLEIAATESRLAALRLTEAKERFSAHQAQLAQARNANDHALETLHTAVKPVIEAIQALHTQLAAIDRTYTNGQTIIESALQTALEIAAAENAPAANDHETSIGFQNIVSRYEAQLDPCLPVWAGLAEIIAQSPDDKTRRIAQGLYFAFIGQLVNFAPETTRQGLRNQVKINQRRQRHRR